MQTDEIKRTARILELVHMIATSPRRFLRRDLAAHFEVSERMIQKDFNIIKHGLKLDLMHSAEGYYFEAIPRLPTLQYSFQEALALLLAVQVARQISGIASGELAAAIARLEALFPTEFSPLLRQLMSTPAIHTQHSHRQSMLKLLNQALLCHQKVEIVYETRSRGGELNRRVVHPYSLLPYVRSWQLIAYCERRKEVLIFKVDRIHEAKLLEEIYSIPADFDLDDYLGQGWGLMRGEAREPEAVLLHFSPEAGSWVSEEYWHSSQRVAVQEDGSIHFYLHLAITPEFINWILYYGDRVIVLAPDWLRDEVQKAHLRAYQKYV